ncbi:mannitol dehydrogenase family protein [Microcella alkalica]|uniref:Mannitol-1-phosphate 5-dehydrogenase n=1 Tax=Microcella alkalica TaxID=355930 RepID=A0A839EBU1_9MICO|nr:fructuronate reductase [Microcella alkalica]
MTIPLTRSALAASGVATDPAPERIVHLGLGAFHRAHQASYTDAVDVERAWGIAAFTGRSAGAAAPLAAQDGLYSLVVRGAGGDSVSVMRSIVRAVDGSTPDQVLSAIAAPATAIVTLTVTEAGYRFGGDGTIELADPVIASDLVLARRVAGGARPAGSVPVSALGRILVGLELRRRAGGPGLAIVPCDNMPSNGELVRQALLDMADAVSDDLTRYVTDVVSFVSTSVDRITPATRDADIATVAELSGWDDRAPVVTEPFSDWVLSGGFPSGRPAWEQAGARIVDDIRPFERRKLWLLNGAHSLLAYAGPARGHETVHEAIADAACRASVERFWDEAEAHLPADLDVPAYRAALLERFENPRIEHRLAQIGRDGSMKLRVRAVPVLRAELAAGRSGEGAASAIAAWMDAAALDTLPPDPAEEEVAAAAAARDSSRALLGFLDPELADDSAALAVVEASRRAAVSG